MQDLQLSGVAASITVVNVRKFIRFVENLEISFDQDFFVEKLKGLYYHGISDARVYRVSQKKVPTFENS